MSKTVTVRLSCEYCVCVCVCVCKNWVVQTLARWDINSKNIHNMCMYVMMRKWTCIESNIYVINEYGFSITFSITWLNLLLGEVTRQVEQLRDFPSSLHLHNLKFFLVNVITINVMFTVNKSSVFTRLVSGNGIRDRIVGRWIIRLASANGIRDRIVGRWIARLAPANGIRDRIAGKWITRLALANDVHVGTPENNW